MAHRCAHPRLGHRILNPDQYTTVSVSPLLLGAMWELFEMIPEEATLTTCPLLARDFSLHAYARRFGNVHLFLNKGVSEYHLSHINVDGQTLPSLLATGPWGYQLWQKQNEINLVVTEFLKLIFHDIQSFLMGIAPCFRLLYNRRICLAIDTPLNHS